MANVKVEVRQATFVDKEGKTIPYNILVLLGVPTGNGLVDIQLVAQKDYQKQYLKDYLKVLSQK